MSVTQFHLSGRLLSYHILNANNPPKNNNQRQNQQCNLHTRANSNTNSEIHLVLAGHRHSGSVLSRVTNNGEKDQSDECLADVTGVSQSIDGRNLRTVRICHNINNPGRSNSTKISTYHKLSTSSNKSSRDSQRQNSCKDR